MKRPYPFSLDNPPGPPFSIKFPAFVAPMRVDEPASCRNGGSFNLETSNPKLRLASCHLFDLFYYVLTCFCSLVFEFLPHSEKALHAQLPFWSRIQRIASKKMVLSVEIFSHYPSLLGHLRAQSSTSLLGIYRSTTAKSPISLHIPFK